MIIWRVRMGLAMGELFAVQAWVRWVLDVAAQATAVATTSIASTSASVIASLATAMIVLTVVAGSVSRGVAVILGGRCALGDVSVGFGICCLEQLGE